METRIDILNVLPQLVSQLSQVEADLAKGRLPSSLRHLVKLRASQINGCAFCLHMHTGEALRDGEPVERLTLLPAFRETPLYSEAERAALAWTEAVTRLDGGGPTDAEYAAVREHFDEEQTAQLNLAIAMINLWNRMAVPMRAAHPEGPLHRATDAA